MVARKSPAVAPVKRVSPAKHKPAPPARKVVKPKAPIAAKKVVAATAATAALSLEAAKGKHKLVRDSFTIPKVEYTVLQDLKSRASGLKRPTKKSELLRAGIAALAALSDTAFLTALGKVRSLKTGRPKDPTRAG